MINITRPAIHGAAALHSRGISANDRADPHIPLQDITKKWLNDMVKRVFAELNRQLAQIEACPAPEGVKGEAARATNARTLASLERTLERLSKLEMQRAEQNHKLAAERKVQNKHASAREKLEQRLDRLVAAHTQSAGDRQPD
ncbi:MAG: hypothetical protein WCD42_04215 [Rhizomicrobium sp.]